MPYLRYSRDKRGYEHTYVLHGSRAGGRPRILYWFRTPPHVVVGRDALDEEATKAIEASHPGLDFDWSKMRRERPKPPPRSVGIPERMQKGNRRSGPAPVKASPRVSAKRVPAVEVAAKTTSGSVSQVVPEMSEGAASLESAISTSSTQPLEHPVSALLGDEMLVKWRSVYEELNQQLQSAQLTESSKNEIVSRVQSLNPDSWLAGEEVILRIEKFDSEVAAIQGLLSNA
jgi:hypothetical protein